MLRFAPSPTGDMHIANLRVALLNYLVAQQRNERFVVRIEDRDKVCNIEGKDTEIMQILEKFALIHDAVFHQSEHLHMHQTFAIKLLEQGKAFVCTCTPEQLNVDKEEAAKNKVFYQYSGHCNSLDNREYQKLKNAGTPFVIRIKKPNKDIISHDFIKGERTTRSQEVDSFIILKEDGIPTYDFACACDDMLSGLDFIIRCETYFSNTPKQEYIKTQLGYNEITMYTHLPFILNTEGKKISEYDDIGSFKWLFEKGFVPDAILNYLLLLDNPNVPKEIFTLPEAIKWFNLKNISKSTTIFDIDKLRFINKKHLEMMDDKKLSSFFGFADENIGKLAKLYLEEASTIEELKEKIEPIFSPKDFTLTCEKEMHILKDIIYNAEMIDDFYTFKSYLIKKSALKEQSMVNALRLLLTGAHDGPELSEIYPLIKSYLLEVAS